jgi:RNA polymerase sigma-70 factor (ECF subfamily)
MADSPTDGELVKRAQGGDKRAFDLLVSKYQHRVIKLVGRYVHEPADVLDVVQDSFLKAYRALPQFRGESAFYTWIYRIAVNTAKNFLVSASRRPLSTTRDDDFGEPMSLEELQPSLETPEHLFISDEIRSVIVETMEGLPHELREALTLREIDGMSYEQIADVMECPIGTVRSRIFRAREAIDLKLKPLLEN